MPEKKKTSKAPARKTRKPLDTPRLTRDDWLDAAFQAVVEGGFDKLRVLTIADTLGVTRGSFYWHFADHADLLAALLARWQQREVELDQIIQASATTQPQDDLERLLETALAHAGVDLKNMRFELALRGLGRRDADVARMLVDVDRARMKLFEGQFLRLTGNAQTASELATLFYLAIVGSNQALSRPSSPPRAKELLKAIITRYLIHDQAHPKPARAPRR
jgi:AcrR family transcriptional regulator